MNENHWSKTTVILGMEGSMSSSVLWLNSSSDVYYAALHCYASGDNFVAEECLIRNATTGSEIGMSALQYLNFPLADLYGDRRQSVLYASGFLAGTFASSGSNLTVAELPVAVWAKNILSQQETNLLVLTKSGSSLGQWCLTQNIPIGDLSSIGMFNGFPQIEEYHL